MRGEQCPNPMLLWFPLWITPACAGSRSPFCACMRPIWDHPRMRGEQILFSLCPLVSIGSPPHARGAASLLVARSSVGMDHPRMRGEQWSVTSPSSFTMGSPPHARGAGYGILLDENRRGITPACAGSRLKKYRVIKDSSYSSIKFPLTSDRSHM